MGRGLVHGSVRPSNILVEAVADAASVGRVGLVGFGLWQQVDRASLLADGAREVGYLAPEQVMGEEPSSRSDQYALACVLCECLTGQPPFTGNAGAVLGGHLRERPISLREPGPELPAGIDLAIAKALGKRPEDRFGTCSEFASALTALPAVGETRPVLSVEPGWAVGETAAALPDGPAGARRRSTAATRDETEPTPSPRPARVSPGQLAPLAIAAVAAAIAIVLAVLLLSNGSDEPASIAAEPLSGDADPAASNTEPLPGNEPAATATEPLPADLELFSGRPAPELAGPASVASPAPRVSLLWSRVSLDEAVFGGVGDLVMSSVAAGRLGLVAVGRDDPVAAVWTSADGVNWSRVPDEESVFSGEGNTVMLSVTAGGPGLVAVGSDSKRAVVWTSVDGLTWSRVPHDEAIFGGDLNPIMNDVTAGGPGLVAVGSDCAGLCTDASPHSAAVWTSVDGVSWSRVPHDEAVFGGEGIQAMESVAAGGPGLVAVGADNPDDFGYTGAVWTSVDGLTWSRVPDDEEVFAHAQIGSVSAGGPGLVAVGFGSNSDLGPNGLSAAVWTSIDGRSWSRVPHDEAVFGGEGLQAMEGVTAGGPGLVAVGRDCPNRCLGSSTGDAAAPVWTSVDGVTWSRVSPGGTVLDGEMWGVSVGGPGLVAVGRVKRDTPGPFRDAAAWTSADGLGWSRVSQEQEVFGAAEMVSVAAGGLGLVAVGRPKPEGGARTVPPDERHALVWASVDGVVWSRVPHDEAVFGEGSFIADVTAGGPGLVAVGGDSEGGAVWTSVDGLSWSRAADDAAVAGGAGAVELGSVTVGGPGLVAVGRDEQGAAVWTSVDGLTWSRVPDQDSLVGGWMIGVTAGGPGIVAVGVDDSDGDGAPDGAVWTSVDGFAWSRVSRDEAVSGEGSFFFDVTAGGPGLVAVSDGGLWASVDGTTWSRVPTDETGQPVATDVVANGPGLVAVGSNGRDPWVGTSPTALVGWACQMGLRRRLALRTRSLASPE